jgi:hypothetical protein
MGRFQHSFPDSRKSKPPGTKELRSGGEPLGLNESKPESESPQERTVP